MPCGEIAGGGQVYLVKPERRREDTRRSEYVTAVLGVTCQSWLKVFNEYGSTNNGLIETQLEILIVRNQLKPVALALVLAVLGGCASGPRKPQPSFLVDASDGAVKVKQPFLGSPELTKAVAVEGCGVYNREAIGPLSRQRVDQYCMEQVFLFQCKVPTKP